MDHLNKNWIVILITISHVCKKNKRFAQVSHDADIMKELRLKSWDTLFRKKYHPLN